MVAELECEDELLPIDSFFIPFFLRFFYCLRLCDDIMCPVPLEGVSPPVLALPWKPPVLGSSGDISCFSSSVVNNILGRASS